MKYISWNCEDIVSSGTQYLSIEKKSFIRNLGICREYSQRHHLLPKIRKASCAHSYDKLLYIQIHIYTNKAIHKQLYKSLYSNLTVVIHSFSLLPNMRLSISLTLLLPPSQSVLLFLTTVFYLYVRRRGYVFMYVSVITCLWDLIRVGVDYTWAIVFKCLWNTCLNTDIYFTTTTTTATVTTTTTVATAINTANN